VGHHIELPLCVGCEYRDGDAISVQSLWFVVTAGLHKRAAQKPLALIVSFISSLALFKIHALLGNSEHWTYTEASVHREQIRVLVTRQRK
jgi:hypothetical protein